jgi:hypothetical protein
VCQCPEWIASATAWVTRRRLWNVKVSEITALQPSVPKLMGILLAPTIMRFNVPYSITVALESQRRAR